jgi:hypothetical protein
MKEDLFEYYQRVRVIRESIDNRIKNEDVQEYLEQVIKNNFLESQNFQILLNL